MIEADVCDDLWTAVGEGRLSEVCRIVKTGVDINQTFSKGMTALHFATCQGHKDIVQYLVQCGADVNKPNDCGQTPLMSACSRHLVDLARFLVLSGSNVNAVNICSDNVLLHFCKLGASPVRRQATLINTDAGSMHGFYRICTAEEDCDCLDFVKLLVDAGVNVNFVDCEGMTALMRFIMCKHFEVAKFLIQSGTNINHISNEGVTALLLACQFRYSLELVEMLVSAGADVNHAKTHEGSTPLMVACYHNIDCVKALIHAGASVNAANIKGDTALTYAVFGRNPSVIESLIQAGARVAKELVLAVIIGDGESIQALITSGAMPRLTGSMLSLKSDIEYLSRRFSVWTSSFLQHKLLQHLEALDITSLTPFMIALMRRDTIVARYFVNNLFFHPLDIVLLHDFRKKGSTLEDDGLSPCLSPVITQPWSLFSLSFLCVSFAIGFGSDRKKLISLTGLPFPLQQKFLYCSKTAYHPAQEWANLDLSV